MFPAVCPVAWIAWTIAIGALVQGATAVATVHRISWGNANVDAATITVATGDTVTWVLDQQGGHNVISGPSHGVADHRFSSPWMAGRNEMWSYTFTTAGDYPYFCNPHSWMVARITVVDPTPPPTAPPTNYCQEGYADYGVRYNHGLGKITIVSSHEACSARCTQYSGPEFSGGCKGYQSGMFFGMLYCRSYGGQRRDQQCAPFAHPSHPGQFSGELGSTDARTNMVNIGGNCCSNSTFVEAEIPE